MDIQKPKPRLGWRIVAIVGAIYALFVAAQDIDWLVNFAGLVEHGDFGVDGVPAPEIARGMGRVIAVQPGSSAAAAGIRAGDGIRTPERWKLRRVPAVGD